MSQQGGYLIGQGVTAGDYKMSELNGGADSLLPFAPKNAPSNDADQLDRAGQTILKLLHKAAGVAEANSQHALEMAQKFSHQLRAAENRIAELEAEVEIYQEKSERAELWLHKIYMEIEDRFRRQADVRSVVTGPPQRPAARRA